MIKILHLTTSFGMGGAEGNLARLVCGMNRSRFANSIVAMNRRLIVSDQVRECRIPCASLGMRPGTITPSAILRLVRIVRHVRPDIVQTWMYHADLLGLLVGKLAAVPVIAWNIRCSLIDMSQRWSSALVRGALVRLSRFPQVVIANSQSGLLAHQSLGYRPRAWRWIPNSIDLDRFRPRDNARAALRAELGVSDDAILIGLVARFHPMKDHASFFAAARALATEYPHTHFVLAGWRIEPGNPQLESWITSTGLRHRFHLFGLRKDIEWITAGLDIACSSSAYGEGSSNAIAEAMACGVPCVATDVGDSALIVGNAGKIVPPRSPLALAQACREMLALSPPERHALGSRARARIAERSSICAVVDSYERLYEELLMRPEAGTQRTLLHEQPHDSDYLAR